MFDAGIGLFDVIALLLTGLAALVLAVAYFESSIWSPVLFVGIAFCLRIGGPVIDIVFNPPSMAFDGPNFTTNMFLMALAIMLTGIIAFAIGYLHDLPRQISLEISNIVPFIADEKNSDQDVMSWDLHRAIITSIIMGIIGIFCYVLLLQDTGLPASLSDISDKRTIQLSAYFLVGINLLHVSTILNAITFSRYPNAPTWWRVWAGGIGLVAITYPVYVSNRGLLGVFLLSLIIVYHYMYSELHIRKIALIFLTGVMGTSLLAGFRKIARNPNLPISSYILPSDALGTVFGATRGGVVVFAKALTVFPEQITFKFGKSMLFWLITPLPGRPLGFTRVGNELSRLLYKMPGNRTPPTIIGELYLNYSILGVIIGMIIIGSISRTSYEILEENPSPATLLFYILCGPVFVFYSMIGTFSVAMIHLLTWGIPLAISTPFIISLQTSSGNKPDYESSIIMQSTFFKTIYSLIGIMIDIMGRVFTETNQVWQNSTIRSIVNQIGYLTESIKSYYRYSCFCRVVNLFLH